MKKKACSVCKVAMPRAGEFYYARRASKDGLSPRCKECDKALCDRRRVLHRGEAAQTAAEWRAANPERSRLTVANWAERNRQHIAEQGARYRAIFGTARSAYMRAWRKDNPEKSRDCSGARRIAIELATPPWLTDLHFAAMRRVYKLRDQLIEDTGAPHEVDHIVPLRNKLVCGLHVPWNLRVVTKEVNQRKRNYLEEHHAAAQA